MPRAGREDTMWVLMALMIQTAGSTVGPYMDVDLQSGFEGWRTFVYLDDSLVFRGDPESISMRGFACRLELMCRSTLVELRVRIPEVAVDTTFSIDIHAGGYLGINLAGEDSGLMHMILDQSPSPFGYD